MMPSRDGMIGLCCHVMRSSRDKAAVRRVAASRPISKDGSWHACDARHGGCEPRIRTWWRLSMDFTSRQEKRCGEESMGCRHHAVSNRRVGWRRQGWRGEQCAPKNSTALRCGSERHHQRLVETRMARVSVSGRMSGAAAYCVKIAVLMAARLPPDNSTMTIRLLALGVALTASAAM